MKTFKRSLESERLVTYSKELFEAELQQRLNLTKVNAPLFVSQNSGLNDNLNGVEKPVTFKLGDEAVNVLNLISVDRLNNPKSAFYYPVGDERNAYIFPSKDYGRKLINSFLIKSRI